MKLFTQIFNYKKDTNALFKDKYLNLFLFLNFIIVFYYYCISTIFADAKYFNYVDILFDTDTFTFLKFIKEPHPRIHHPLLHLFYTPGAILKSFFNTSWEASLFAIHFLFVFLKNTFFYLILKKLNFKPIENLILSSAFTVLGTNLLFGAIPEHFNISNTLILLMLLLMIDFQKKKKFEFFVLALTGFFLAGITITNLITFSLCLATWFHFSSTKKKFKDIIAQVSKISIIICTGLGVVYLASEEIFRRLNLLWILHSPPDAPGRFKIGSTNVSKIFWDTFGMKEFLSDFSQGILWHISNNLKAVWNSFYLFGATNTPNGYGECTYGHTQHNLLGLPCFSFNLLPETSSLIITGYILFLLSILYMFYLCSKKHFPLTCMAFLPLIFNLLLHTVWGLEPFLFTQHYVVFLFLPLCLLLKGKTIAQFFLFATLAVVNISFINIELVN